MSEGALSKYGILQEGETDLATPVCWIAPAG
jgi:hypothetical protein